MLKASIIACNPAIDRFETSCFDGNYVTGDVTAAYLDGVENQRKGAPRQSEDESGQLDLNLVTSEENA
jgi:amidophosphoribosyltransferase